MTYAWGSAGRLRPMRMVYGAPTTWKFDLLKLEQPELQAWKPALRADLIVDRDRKTRRNYPGRYVFPFPSHMKAKPK